MANAKYLIIGSSHAGLAALDAIRRRDGDETITMLTREKHLPYSPTILPYIVSGETDPDKVFLRTPDFFQKNKVELLREATVVGLDTVKRVVTLEDGRQIGYEKLLVASGAAPEVHAVPGLDKAPYSVLRTLNDALQLKGRLQGLKSAIILGAGLIGMHAAENLAKAGLSVTVTKPRPQVLRGYFDQRAGAIIQKVFCNNGVKILTGHKITHVASNGSSFVVSLENGLDLNGEELLVATGARPCMDFVANSGVECNRGILVDDFMRTSVPNVWAAGDVAQAKDFFSEERILNGVLPAAVEQGRIAGMDMVGDSYVKPFGGAISLNTYRFFGQRAFSVGNCLLEDGENEAEVDYQYSPSSLRYQKLVFQGDSLVGAMGINTKLDPGIMWGLIRRRQDMSSVKSRFVDNPQEVGRLVMYQNWR